MGGEFGILVNPQEIDEIKTAHCTSSILYKLRGLIVHQAAFLSAWNRSRS